MHFPQSQGKFEQLLDDLCFASRRTRELMKHFSGRTPEHLLNAEEFLADECRPLISQLAEAIAEAKRRRNDTVDATAIRLLNKRLVNR